MDTFASLVSLAEPGTAQDLLDAAWRASGRRVATALAILSEIKLKAAKTQKASTAAPLRQTSRQPKLSFAAVARPAGCAPQAPTAAAVGRSSAAPVFAPRPAVPSAPHAVHAASTIDLVSSSDEDTPAAIGVPPARPTRDSRGAEAAAPAAAAAPSSHSVEAAAAPGAWPRALPLLTILSVSLVRGALPEVSPSTPLDVWHEVSVSDAAAASAAGGGGSGAGSKRGRGKRPAKATGMATGGSAFGDPYADIDAGDFSSTNVRFGLRASVGSIGRLPPELSRWLAPLLDHGLAEAVAYVPFRPAVLSIAASLDIDVVVTLHEGAARLLRGSQRVTSAVMGSVVPPLDRALAQALFEVCFFCTHGRPPAQPRTTAELAAAPAPKDPSPMAAAEAGAAAALEGEAAAADNAEERVSAGDAAALQEALESAPSLPLALQPALLPALRLRYYQRQALAWMIGRERAKAPKGEDGAAVVAAAAAAGAGLVAVSDEGAGSVSEEEPRGRESRAPAQQRPPPQRELLDNGEPDAAAVSALVHESAAAAAMSGGAIGRAAFGNAASMWERQTFGDGVSELWLNPYTRTASLFPPPRVPPCLSGILCDGELR